MSKEPKQEFCNRCKYWHPPVEFLNDQKRKLKLCLKCREYSKSFNAKHKTADGRWKCPDCEKLFGEMSNLQRHISTVHKKIKAYKCDECETSFGKMSHLRTHSTICTGEFNMSSGELVVMKSLEILKVDYTQEYSAVKNDNGNWLRFDFKVELYGNIMYIEYDGEGHYKPVCFGGISKEKATEAFIKQKSNDEVKNKYCLENNIPLLRIPHFRFDKAFALVNDFLDSNIESK
jgi:hypothetical protein